MPITEHTQSRRPRVTSRELVEVLSAAQDAACRVTAQRDQFRSSDAVRSLAAVESHCLSALAMVEQLRSYLEAVGVRP